MTVLSSKVVTLGKDRLCWGCLHRFPAGSQLLSEAIAYEGSVYRLYTCESCHSETYGWGPDDYESCGYGEVGHWKDGVYHAHE